jgi:hypothetical protein
MSKTVETPDAANPAPSASFAPARKLRRESEIVAGQDTTEPAEIPAFAWALAETAAFPWGLAGAAAFA